MVKNRMSHELYSGEKLYTYFAFISYKREDSKWAVWLKRKLQTYNLPGKLCREHRGIQRNCSPIFLDKSDLRPGYLETQLESEIRESKFLIVLCSQAACRSSRYLDLEIRLFLENGGDPSRIIPFIVDPAESPEQTCFPQFLQELCTEREIIGANVYELGKRKAFLKVVAYIHGLRVEEVENTDARRRKQNRVIVGLIASAIILGTSFGAWKYWDYHTLKTAYYLDYTEVMGVPVGLHKLSEEEVKSMESHYTFLSRMGKIREMRHETAYGSLAPYPEPLGERRPVHAYYEYLENNQLDTVQEFDEDGNPVRLLDYGLSLKYIDILDYTDEYGRGEYLKDHTLMEEESLVDLSEMEDEEDEIDPEEDSSNTQILRYIVEYDSEGHLQELHYAGAANKALSDADGVSGFRYERDEEGRAVKVTYLVCTKDGASATENDHYESIGTQNGLYSIRYTYSEEGDLSEIRYYGKDEVPMRYYKNAAAIRRSFSGHNMVEEQYCDQDDKPILNKERFAIDRIEYDEHGNPVKMSYYGPDGERILRTRNYAVSTRDYDDEGRIVRIGFYGLEEEPVLTEENFAACTYVYDDNGRKSEARYYGTDGELITNVVGFASVHFQYDDVGHVTRVDFYDTEAAPVCSAYGGASCVSEYDEAGNEIRDAYYGPDGGLIIGIDGYAVCERQYNGLGQETGQRFYGTDGQPIALPEGYAKCIFSYDDAGNLSEIRYYGIDGKPVLLPDGYAGLKNEYDESGRLISKKYLDVDGEPVESRELDCAEIRIEYTENGNRKAKSFYDANGTLTICSRNYASCTYETDSRGNETRVCYFGLNGEPVISIDGFASFTNAYDDQVNLTDIKYYGTDGEPVLGSSGCAMIHLEYDDRRNCTGWFCYGTKGEPIMNIEGYFGVQIRYDEGNEVMEIRYYDKQGREIQL